MTEVTATGCYNFIMSESNQTGMNNQSKIETAGQFVKYCPQDVSGAYYGLRLQALHGRTSCFGSITGVMCQFALYAGAWLGTFLCAGIKGWKETRKRCKFNEHMARTAKQLKDYSGS